MGEDLRYPLTWPHGWPRAEFHKRAQFNQKGARGYAEAVTVATAMDRLGTQIKLLGVSSPMLSTNITLTLAGAPRSGQPKPEDPGVAFYFDLDGIPTVLACDKWDTVADNIVAIAKHIEALRGMDRWGVGNLKQAFAGYTALPSPHTTRHWWQILGVAENASREQISFAYREKMRKAHPDIGGTAEEAALLNAARDEAVSKWS